MPVHPLRTVERVHVVGEHSDDATRRTMPGDQIGHLRTDQVVAGRLVEVLHQAAKIEAERRTAHRPVLALGDLAGLPPHVLGIGTRYRTVLATTMVPSVSSALPIEFERRQQHRSPEVEQQMLERRRCGHDTSTPAPITSNNAFVRSGGTLDGDSVEAVPRSSSGRQPISVPSGRWVCQWPCGSRQVW